MKDGVGDHLSSGVGDEAEPGSSEDVESEVAAALGPFVGLLSKNRLFVMESVGGPRGVAAVR